MATARRKTPRRDARTAARRKTILALRAEGLTLAAIGARLGITRQSVHEALQKELAEVAAERRDLAGHQFEVALARCEFALAGSAPKVAKGDPKATMSYLRAVEIIAKLLGLNPPDRHEHIVDVKKLSDADLDAEIARLTALAGGPGASGDAAARKDPPNDGASEPSG